MSRKQVLSRHRLPNRYRYSIVALWLAPLPLLVLTILVGKGVTAALLDPRFLVAMGLLTLPAIYIWQEGLDVLPNGIRTRVHLPRYHDYGLLESWYFDRRTQRGILTIWDKERRKVLECHAAHLSHLPLLLDTLEHRLPAGQPRS